MIPVRYNERMPILDELPLEKLTSVRLWGTLDAETRTLAARALYDPDWEDVAARMEAEMAIAGALRFRKEAVRRLPVEKRVRYLATAVRPEEPLAGGLLRALHLGAHSEMLGRFLDTLGIPQENGVIESDDGLEPPKRPALEEAAASLRESYPAADVELYLATLLAFEPEFWSELAGLLRSEG
jgi:hypothetical protein